MNRPLTLASIILSAFLAAACDDGPAENAGEELDDAASDLGNAVEDACEDIKESAGAEEKDC